MTHEPTAKARAYRVFKSLLDLDAAAIDRELTRLAREDADLHEAVSRLVGRDRRADELLDRPGAGADELLADDLLTSMIARGEVDTSRAPERIGPYRLIGELGRGGMGVVYEAEQDDPKRRVAIKTTHAWLRKGALAERFRVEVQALAALRHRAIPRLFEVREEAGATWMVMELVRGEALDVYAARLSIPQRLRLLIEVVDGIAHAHAVGIAHRDLKPANIVVSEGQPRILDFGLAGTLDPDSDASESPTRRAGTLAYMAPEVLEGQPEDRRADIYGLGVILYEVLTSERPPSATGQTHAELRANKRLPPPKVSHRRGLGRDLDFILARALAPDPAARYDDASELAADLERYLAGRPVSARRNTLVYRLERFVQRQRRPLLAVGVTLLVAGIVAGSVALLRAQDEARAALETERRAAERLEILRERDVELRARGAITEAEALFAYFTQSPDHARTRALHEAWLWRGQTNRARIAPNTWLMPSDPRPSDAAREAFAEAYGSAVDDAGRGSALLELGRLFQHLERFDGVRRVLELLGASGETTDPRVAGPRCSELEAGERSDRSPCVSSQVVPRRIETSGERRDGVEALRFASHAERRDLRAAAAVDLAQAREVAPVLEALSRGTPLGIVATNAAAIPLPDGVAVGMLDQPVQLLKVVRPGRGEVARFEFPADTRYANNLPQLLSGLEHCAVVPRLDGRTLVTCLEPDTMTFRPLVEVPVSFTHSAIGWVGPRGPEFLLGTANGDRGLYHWRAGELTKLPPEVVGPASDVDTLLRADLDGDGEVEFLAAFGAWRNYDLRVFRQTDQGFEPRARKRLGTVQQVQLLARAGAPPLIATLKVDAYPNPTLLGPTTPYGAPAGIYLFELSGDSLVERQRLPLPQTALLDPIPHRLLIGDLDGDGLQDIVLGTASARAEYTAILRQVEPGRFAEAFLGSMSPLGIYPLERRDGLLVRTFEDAHGWLLGQGELPLPEAPLDDPPVEAPPPPSPELASDWQHATELDSMGLTASAARRVEAAAKLTVAPRASAEALIRAAALWIRAGRPDETARLIGAVLKASPPPELVERAHLERARAHLALHDIAAAVGDLMRTPLDPAGTGSRAHVLAVAEKTSPAFELIDAGELDLRWQLQRPLAITRTDHGARASQVTCASGDGVLAAIPVEYRGGAITVRVDLTVEHLEIGVQLKLRLRDGERDLVWFDLFGQGGGLVLTRLLGFGPSRGMSPPSHSQPHEFFAPPELLEVMLGVMPTQIGAELVGRVRSGENQVLDRRMPLSPFAPGRLMLELVSGGEPGGAVTSGRIRLERISVAGLVPYTLPGGDPLARALYERDYAAAKIHGAGLSPWARADLFVELGDSTAAAHELGALVDEGFWSSHELSRRLRLGPRVWLPIVASLDRERALQALTTAWGASVRYLGLPDTLDFLALPALAEVDAARPENRLILAALLRAGLRMKLDGSAYRHALSVAEAEAPPEDRAGRTELALLAAAHHERAGDEPRARRLFARWRESVPFPELAFDSLRHDPDAGHLSRWLEVP